MDKEKIKLIVRNMELLVDALKQEISDTKTDEPEEEFSAIPYEEDYDEVFSE
jgi:hypothetical protein